MRRHLVLVAAFVAVTLAAGLAPAQPRFRLFRRDQGYPCPCECAAAPLLAPAAPLPQTTFAAPEGPLAAPSAPFAFRDRVTEIAAAPDNSGFPVMPHKPHPQAHAFNGCAAEGKGGDPELNYRKNRSDTSNEWKPVPFNVLLHLPFPEGIPPRRDHWSQAQINSVGRYEGTPVSVECFILEAHKAGKESCNCGKSSADMVDYHVDLVNAKDDERDTAVVAEVTGRLRAQHPEWTLAAIKDLAKKGSRVRISGWVLLDQIHEDLIDEGIRGTIWEIHPIMKIEVKKGNNWVELGAP